MPLPCHGVYFTACGIRRVLLGALLSRVVYSEDTSVTRFYGTYEVQRIRNTSFQEVKKLLLGGRPFVIVDGARDLPMASWDCNFVQKEFPESRIRQEGGKGDINGIKMSSDWTSTVKPFASAAKFPEGAPKNRPFYWDIAKAYQDETHRKWGKDPGKVVQKLVSSSAVPYWLPKQGSTMMGHSSEMWFHPKGAGAPAHMDPHCKTTVSFCFSGVRKWRMMVPPELPHPEGYFDGQIYGTEDKRRRGEWQPTFDFEAPAGSAVLVYPGMVHETLSTGEECSSSISQTFEVPVAAAYFRAFWPRFALIHEDVGRCSYLVQSLANLGSGAKVPPKEKAAREAAEKFVAKIDSNGDGVLSEKELEASNKKPTADGSKLTADELISFHDVDNDGTVTAKEIVESWAMFGATAEKVRSVMKGQKREL